MPPKGFYTIEEASQELSAPVSEIENLIRSGKMREQVVGKKRLVPAYSVQAVLRHRDQVSDKSLRQ
jgi:excisionase family DNA binding protein